MKKKISNILTNILANIIAYVIILLLIIALFSGAILGGRLLIYNVIFPLFCFSPVLGFIIAIISPTFLLIILALKELK